ncbi:phosphonate ABC transporter substrate-binding protein [Glaciimonas immobilis]|uniref:Phosphonate transport system substrate-binding protein n=1 Tax=Glaciimonas immobilis TaxID=728004 RepID=A0A840RWH6_9BURK|nr:phosphonate ABC transporter substrate-binding protein [Glaciimonas immobilis]KAF3997197.1 phosphonate ABC transporter substrate-binding protein [Glaciimonas immobilis]MBB5202235.1 phosphonate transport system substrate-binding protein [Glaciimonas immobilis]
MLKKLMTTAALAFAVLAAGAVHAQEAEKSLNFGIISTESSKNLKQDWQPVLDEMSKKLGMKVNAFFASDYAGIIEGMRFGKVQMAWFGNKSAMEAVDRAGGEVFAHVVNPDGSEGYYSMVGVPKDSPIKSIDDIVKNAKVLNFGIGDPNSTSGFLVPGYYIFAKNNLDSKTAFKTIRSANHESNILAIANKQVDAAVFASDTMDRITARLPDMASKVRVVWKSPLIAADPLVWRKDLPQATKSKIKDFFLSYGKTGPNAVQEKAQLEKLQFSGFKDSTDAQLNPVRQLELFKDKNKIEADTTLNLDDKKAKLDDINRKLTELAKA